MADISTYKDAGVDIDKADTFIKSIQTLVKSTYRTGVLGEIGSFGGLFHLGSDRYRDPVLVSGTDGVGTKLKIAILMNRHDTIGIDLVAMCANDIVVHGKAICIQGGDYRVGKHCQYCGQWSIQKSGDPAAECCTCQSPEDDKGESETEK